MKHVREFIVSSFVGGVLIVVPIYLSVCSCSKLCERWKVLCGHLPSCSRNGSPPNRLLSLLLVLVVCFLIGVAVRAPAGRAARERIEKSLFERIPGYAALSESDPTTGGKS